MSSKMWADSRSDSGREIDRRILIVADRHGEFAKHSGRGRGRVWLSGSKPRPCAQGIERLKSVPGRLEKVANNLDITILVDYAHTPDALEKVLGAVRPIDSREAHHRVRLWRRSRPRQAAVDGRDRGAVERRRGAHVGQSAHAKIRRRLSTRWRPAFARPGSKSLVRRVWSQVFSKLKTRNLKRRAVIASKPIDARRLASRYASRVRAISC